jgi:hypothetical protein
MQGIGAVKIEEEKVLLASPEKALLDFWYSMEGEWSLAQFPERKRSGIVY